MLDIGVLFGGVVLLGGVKVFFVGFVVEFLLLYEMIIVLLIINVNVESVIVSFCIVLFIF